jgi:hypothetical protein
MRKDNYVRMRLGSEQLGRWRDFCKDSGLDVSKLVRVAVEEYINSYKGFAVGDEIMGVGGVEEFGSSLGSRVESLESDVDDLLSTVVYLMEVFLRRNEKR